MYQANESQAIDTLLITDKLFRASSVETRKKYVALVESVMEDVRSQYTHSCDNVQCVRYERVGLEMTLTYVCLCRL